MPTSLAAKALDDCSVGPLRIHNGGEIDAEWKNKDNKYGDGCVGKTVSQITVVSTDVGEAPACP